MTEQPIEKKSIEADWNFTAITVSDCIAEKIPASEFLTDGTTSVKLSWLHIIALINRKSKDDKRINTKITVQDLMALYGKMMGSSFL